LSEPEVEYATFAIPDADGLVATFTLNRPQELNAMTWEMIKQLDEAITRAADDNEVRVVFVTGKGRAFSAGGDLKRYIELQRDPVRFPQFVGDLHRVFGRLRTLRVPVIALVNGVTAAGGLELLLNCDLALAASSARIGDGHLNFGQMGGGGVLTLLARVIGIRRAAELIMTGDIIAAEVLADWGLIGRVVADDDLMAEGLKIATSIARKSAAAVANAKYVMNTVWAENSSVEAGLHLELERNALYCLTSEDAREGLRAFSEKREPRFKGR
jgi:enoyl-CoA hydratase/carnithine racemase